MFVLFFQNHTSFSLLDHKHQVYCCQTINNLLNFGNILIQLGYRARGQVLAVKTWSEKEPTHLSLFKLNSWTWKLFPSPKNTQLARDLSAFIPSIISFLKVIYWKLTVPILPSWKSVFPRTLNLCREHTTKYSPQGVYNVILPSQRGTYGESTLPV